MQDFMNLLAERGIKEKLSDAVEREDFKEFDQIIDKEIIGDSELRLVFARKSYSLLVNKIFLFLWNEKHPSFQVDDVCIEELLKQSEELFGIPPEG